MAPINPPPSSRSPLVVVIVIVLIVIAVLIAVWLRKAGFNILPDRDSGDTSQLTEEQKAELLANLKASSDNNAPLTETQKDQLIEGLNVSSEANAKSPTEAEKQQLLKSLQQ